jgi:hypothetical protein
MRMPRGTLLFIVHPKTAANNQFKRATLNIKGLHQMIASRQQRPVAVAVRNVPLRTFFSTERLA